MPHRRMISRSRLIEILNRFSERRIMVVGDLMLDRYIYGRAERISPEAPVPVVLAERESVNLGGAGNVIRNLRTLSAQVIAIGVTGEDSDGTLLHKLLKHEMVDAHGVFIDPGRPTTVKTRVIAHHQHVVRIDRESTGQVDENIISQMIDYISRRIDEADAIIVSDYAKGVIGERLMRDLKSLASARCKPIVVDPKEPHFGYYEGVSCVTPNRSEAERASGVVIRDEEGVVRAGEKLLEIWRSDMVLITRGEEGMSLFKSGGDITHIPAVARDVYDVTGAGDTVVGVFTLALASGAEPKEAAYIANAAAGVVVGKLGAATVTPQELISQWER